MEEGNLFNNVADTCLLSLKTPVKFEWIKNKLLSGLAVDFSDFNESLYLN